MTTVSYSKALALTDFTMKFGKETGWQAYKHYLNIIGALNPDLTDSLGMKPAGFDEFLGKIVNSRGAKSRGAKLTTYERNCIESYFKNNRTMKQFIEETPIGALQ